MQQFKAAAKKSQQELQLSFSFAGSDDDDQPWAGMSLALSMYDQNWPKGVMNWEEEELVGPKSLAQVEREFQRWGKQAGDCVVNGQKVPLQRPRVRDKRKCEVPLGSYQALQQASLLDEAVWRKIMNGLSMRSYGEVVRELEESYGIEKSSVSSHFIEAAAAATNAGNPFTQRT